MLNEGADTDTVTLQLALGKYGAKRPTAAAVPKVYSERFRNRFVGQSSKADTSPQCSFEAADICVPFYIYDIKNDTKVEDIVAYIKHKTKLEVSLQKVHFEQNTGYSAYRFLIPKRYLHVFMAEDFWPPVIRFTSPIFL